MSELKSNVRALATDLKQGATYDKDSLTVKFEDAEAKVVKHLPEGVTLDQIKDVQSALIDASAAVALATGEIAQKELKGDPDQRVTAKATVGYSAIETAFTGRASGTTAGKDWTKHGKSRTDLVIGVGRKNAPMKEVQKFLAETSESIFSN